MAQTRDIFFCLLITSVLAPAANAQRVYWTNNGRIQRANLDGSDIETILAPRLNKPLYTAIDEIGGKIYWTDGQLFGSAPVIRRCNLDGTDIENIVTQGLTGPAGIAVDVEDGKVYWADSGLGAIKRTDLDGANPEIVLSGLTLPNGLALDPIERKLYWTGKGDDFFTTVIRRANLDGSNIEPVFDYSFGGPTLYAVAVDGVHRKVYWRDTTILRTNIDGSDVEDLQIPITNAESAIEIDPTSGKLLWSDDGLFRANLDGSNVETILPDADALHGLSLHNASNELFWTSATGGDARIRSIDLNNSEVTVVVTPVINPQSLSIDWEAGYLYWSDPGSSLLPDGAIRRSHLNGHHVETVLHTEWLDVAGVALDVADEEMYYLGRRAVPTPQGSIERAGMDGNNVDPLVAAGLITPKAIALDTNGGKIYWTDTGSRDIRRANLNGSGQENLITMGLTTPNGIAIDIEQGKMYWTDGGTMKVQWANLDGSNMQDLLTTGLANPEGIAIDFAHELLYWVERDTYTGLGTIRSANLDGTDARNAVNIGLSSPRAMSLDVRATGDVNADGQFNLRDIQSFQNCFTGASALYASFPMCSFFDLAPVDGQIDLTDFANLN